MQPMLCISTTCTNSTTSAHLHHHRPGWLPVHARACPARRLHRPPLPLDLRRHACTCRRQGLRVGPGGLQGHVVARLYGRGTAGGSAVGEVKKKAEHMTAGVRQGYRAGNSRSVECKGGSV